MAAKDFKIGRPRKGQWVHVEVDGKKHLGIVCEPDYGQWEEEVETTVEVDGEKQTVKTKVTKIHFRTHPLHDDMAVLEGRLDQVVIPPQATPTGKWLVDMVHPGHALESLGHALVPVERISPVTKREHIPATRLAKAKPDWRPHP